jgi:hypothetical protein
MDHCPLLFFGANEIGVSVFMAQNSWTEMDYQGHTCTTMVEEAGEE